MQRALPGMLAVVIALAGIKAATAAEPIKAGRWQFTSQLQAAGPPAGKPSPRGAAATAGGAKTTYTSCIAADSPVPAELGPQCRLDYRERHGEWFTWSMVCTNSQSSVHSDGEAQYRGESMEATMTSHLPAADGKTNDMTQYITGRYLGPCVQATAMPMTPSHPTAPPPAAARPSEPQAKPADGAPAAARPSEPQAKPADGAPAAANPKPEHSAKTEANAKPAPDTETERDAKAAPQQPAADRRRAARHPHHYARRGYASPRYGAWTAGSVPYAVGFGPAPYSAGGP